MQFVIILRISYLRLERFRSTRVTGVRCLILIINIYDLISLNIGQSRPSIWSHYTYMACTFTWKPAGLRIPRLCFVLTKHDKNIGYFDTLDHTVIPSTKRYSALFLLGFELFRIWYSIIENVAGAAKTARTYLSGAERSSKVLRRPERGSGFCPLDYRYHLAAETAQSKTTKSFIQFSFRRPIPPPSVRR